MKRTLLFALALIAVGCAEPIPDLEEIRALAEQGDATPQPTTQLTAQPCLQKGLDLVPPKHAQECDGEQSGQ